MYPPKKRNPRFVRNLILLLILGVGLLLIVASFSKTTPSLPEIIPQVLPKPQVIGAANTPFVSIYGTKLYLNGKPFRFTGFNAYSLGTLWGTNAGCGGQTTNLDGFFSSLRPNSVVRMWAFQGSMGTNLKTKKVDFGPLDRVATAAAKYNQKLILVFSGQAGTCDDGHWKDKAWFQDGYKKAFNDDNRGLAPLPYIDYVKLIVNHFKNSTTIAMWEPVSEPESSNCASGFKGDGCYNHQSCPDEASATKALRGFYDIVGSTIKNIDKNHIVESGVIGTGQCGAIFDDYSYIHQSPGIDVASYHDYNADNSPMPGDIWNGLQKRLNQMKNIGKPLIIGEAGMLGFKTPECLSLSDRKDKFKAKMDAQFNAGIAGYLPWDWTGGSSPICNYDIGDTDPVMDLIHDYPL